MAAPAHKKDVQRELAKRWTPALAKDGFTPIPSSFLEHYHEWEVTSAEAILIIHLLSHKWDDKKPFPSFARLATRMGMSETAARGHARSLHEKRKLITRIQRPGRTNQFDLTPLFERLESILASKPRKNNKPDNETEEDDDF